MGGRHRFTRRTVLTSSGGILGAISGCASDEVDQTGSGQTVTNTQNTKESSTSTVAEGTSEEHTETSDTPEYSIDSFVETSGTDFVVDGKPFYISGANCSYLIGQGTWRDADYDEVLEDAAALGLSVLRTGPFCNRGEKSLPCHQPEPGVYDERAFEQLDYVIHKAKQLGIRLIIPMVNAWGRFGMNAYLPWSDAASHHDDFYSDEETVRIYREFVEYVLTRTNPYTGNEYRNEPTIMMWELANEPRTFEESDQEAVSEVHTWMRDQARHIKNIDPNHLLGTGSSGFYLEGNIREGRDHSGIDFIQNNQIDEIDACSAHLYVPSWHRGENGGHCDIQDGECVDWISRRVEDAHSTVGKPFYLGEFGFAVDRDSQESAEQMNRRNAVFDQIYTLLAEQGANAGLFWQLRGHARLSNGTKKRTGGYYTVHYPEDSTTAGLIKSFSDTMEEQSVYSW